mmetsp:Transcript_26892/g.45344  ORF Transcript_26892/g.45344 Transcript_26892/m.45344 type:complete len:295 (+) Transcript_26892:91-975(+)
MSKQPEEEDAERKANMMARLDMVAVLEAKEIYDSIMQAFPPALGKAVSKKEREELSLKQPSLVYGEITFEAFGTVIEKIKKVYGLPGAGHCGPVGVLQSRGGIFYDLGSGTGKPVIASAVLHNFDVCYGIELLEGLYSVSLDALNSYNTKGKAKLSNRENETHIQMIQGDFLKLRTKDWRDGDIVFANSTCYDEHQMARIAHLASGMRKGAFFISLTKRLPSSEFDILEYEMYRMNWGDATIFIMQKNSDPNDDAFAASDDDEDEEEDGLTQDQDDEEDKDKEKEDEGEEEADN